MLTLQSAAFGPMGEIPTRHTCDGEDASPPLAWSGAPSGTRSFALIVDDPDAPDPAAPKRVWVHWVVYNIPGDATSLPPGASGQGMPRGAVEGKHDGGGTGWSGPCPPIGRHRYFHKLYALDTVLAEQRGVISKGVLERLMQGHVLESAELVGTYAHQGGKRRG